MNFLDLQEEVWRQQGFNDSNNRRNVKLQKIKDSLNLAMFRMAKTAPSLWCLTQESSLAIVAGTAVYQLDDYCYRVLEMWTEDTYAHKVRIRVPRIADRDGSRNPNIAYPSGGGPYDVVWQPRAGPYKSGASGSSTGASATIGSTTITLGASATPLVAADVGRMIRLNNEQADYKIVTIGSGGLAPTVDRPIQGRIQVAQAKLTDGVAPNYANVRWDLGNPHGFVIKVLPTPTIAATVKYRYAQVPRVMINTDDCPPFDEEYHDLIWKGALKHVCLQGEDPQNYQAYTEEFEARLQEMRDQENDVDDSDDVPWISYLDEFSTSRFPIDAYTDRLGGY